VFHHSGPKRCITVYCHNLTKLFCFYAIVDRARFFSSQEGVEFMSTQNHIVPDLEDILENYPGWLDEAIDTPAVAQLTGVPACTLNTWRCRGGGPSW